VLLIHAGGFSKRLPNVSVIGKIFAALPFGTPYSMLELKLASYIDFPKKMIPGVFVTCADDIELMDPEGDLHFQDPGFTALG
jgi:fucose-1-phosphate guanylyltransferase